MAEDAQRARHFWYDETEEATSGVDVLNLLRRYREAETTMRTRVRADMDMGEKDILALRHLIAAENADRMLRQKDIAAMLGITNASTSVLVDRLVRDGYAERVPHPEDRRSVAVVPTEHGRHEVRSTLQDMHGRMMAVVEDMTASERDVVAAFLRRMIDGVTRPALDAQPDT
ncbi:MarR family winged helix-turn-helix transcriptional regulator [Kocuria sp.]|uniref:MarR family winged helix-turn-helix transcriptional regulator n=1 Tax=Kocuria sp. TaxID=1871328 RepID=UPI0026DC3CCF|nr:MarR family transcriptional regulator [Kocuria sp.]MDO4917993.1 MarR family transcriptional regulator [Kocuria sp.]